VRYNPALDGLRAVAIVLVLGCHTIRFAFPGGWIGVDVFFVLSGYLLTSILLHELRQTGRISLANFYLRRALRLLPALALLAIFQLVRSEFSTRGQEICVATLVGVAYLENLNNVFFWWPFDLMGHTWSLAVEERFYLLWPLTLLFLVRRSPLVWIVAAAVAMAAARFVCWRDGYAEATLQYSVGIRPVGLLVGCALAFLPIGRWRLPPVAAPAALAALLAIGLCIQSLSVFLIAPLATSLATAVLIIGLQHAGLTTAALALPPVRYTGRISYGLYLYHWPLFILGEKWKTHAPFHLYAVGLVTLIFVTAALSYEFVEKPILGVKGRLALSRSLRTTGGR
jgi:peptidoglycan/LPS O-acetylase OafA/YrhL